MPDPGESYGHILSTAVQERIQAAQRRSRAWALGSGMARATRLRLLVAGAVLLVGIVCVAVLRGPVGNTSAFADTLKAMAEVRTAHAVGTSHGEKTEAWLSVDHGYRIELPDRLRIGTLEATWDWDRHSNKVMIYDPEPDVMRRALAELSGTHWLAEVRPGDEYQTSDASLEGKAAKRIDIRSHEGWSATLWIDADTERVARMERSRTAGDGSPVPEDRTDFEYGVTVDPALFEFEPPAEATVVDARIGSVRGILDEALKAAEGTPIHEVTEEKVRLSRRQANWLDFDHPRRREAWYLRGVGSRREWADGGVQVRQGRTVWDLGPRGASVTETDNGPDQALAFDWLFSLKMQVFPTDRPTEVTPGERDGAPIVQVTSYFTNRLTAEVTHKTKLVLVFGLHPGRLIESSCYYDVAGEWRLGEHTRLGYPEKLPEGVFEFKPPPGVTVRDMRTGRG